MGRRRQLALLSMSSLQPLSTTPTIPCPRFHIFYYICYQPAFSTMTMHEVAEKCSSKMSSETMSFATQNSQPSPVYRPCGH